jgi:hypothetical protein
MELRLRLRVESNGRTIFVADAHRGDGKRFIVRSDEKLTAFVELGGRFTTSRWRLGLTSRQGFLDAPLR